MERVPDPELQKRNKQIIDSWLGGDSIDTLARSNGLSPSMVRVIVMDSGIPASDRVRVPRRRPLYQRKPLSNLHTQIGNDISYKRITELDMGQGAFAKNVRLSKQRLAQIECGVCDPSLSELIRIAKYLEISIHELVEDRS